MKEKTQVPEQDATAITIHNEQGEFIKVNDAASEMYEYDSEELVGCLGEKLLKDPDVSNGRIFEKQLKGEINYSEFEIETKSGDIKRIGVESEPIEIDGEIHLRSQIEEIECEQTEPKQLQPSHFNDISSAELTEIVQNVRIDAPSGKMSLSEVMLDIIDAHNEIEQYKDGSLSLHKAVDERLQEEEQVNSESPECQVLKQVKDDIFSLYERVQQ